MIKKNIIKSLLITASLLMTVQLNNAAVKNPNLNHHNKDLISNHLNKSGGKEHKKHNMKGQKAGKEHKKHNMNGKMEHHRNDISKRSKTINKVARSTN